VRQPPTLTLEGMTSEVGTTAGDELNARAKANGYKRGAHREEDSRRDCNKHKDDTIKDLA
jgi:hypothetical protein